MPQNSTRWSYSGNTSFVEPDILEDMGVSMLEDPVANDENIKQLQSQTCIISPICSDSNKKLGNKIYENDGIECHEEIHVNSSINNGNTERYMKKNYLFSQVINLININLFMLNFCIFTFALLFL